MPERQHFHNRMQSRLISGPAYGVNRHKFLRPEWRHISDFTSIALQAESEVCTLTASRRFALTYGYENMALQAIR